MDEKSKKDLQIKDKRQPQMIHNMELFEEINAYAIDYYKDIEGPNMMNSMDNRSLLALAMLIEEHIKERIENEIKKE